MTSRTKVAVGVGVGTMLGVVGIFLIKAALTSKPGGFRKDEVESWASHWQKARECLMGTKPYASKPALALEMREAFSYDIDEVYKDCALRLEKTRRPPATSTGNKKVEQMWIDVGMAVRALEQAVRVRLDRFTEKRRNAIAQALQLVDQQYARLSEAAGTPAPVPSSGATELKILRTKPLRWAGGNVRTTSPLRQLGATWLAQIRQTEKSRERMFVIAGQKQVTKHERAIDPSRALTDVWGVWIKRLDELAPDKNKTPSAKSPAKPPAASADAGVDEPPPPTHAITLKVGEEFRVIARSAEPLEAQFHLGAKDTHLVGYKAGTSLHIAESTDAGKKWTQTVKFDGPLWTVVRLSLTRVMVTLSGPGMRAYLDLDIEAPKRSYTPIVIARDQPHGINEACLASKTTKWWRLPDGRSNAALVREVNGTMTILDGRWPMARLSTCTEDHVTGIGLTANNGITPVLVCEAKKCQPAYNTVIPGAAHLSAVRTAKGEVVAALTNKRLLSVWRDGKRSYYRLRTSAQLVQLAVFDGKVHAILQRGTKLRYLVLPAS